MMAIMTDGNKEELPKEFVEGGRTGRRNAMPDILHSDANVTTADLPDRLQQLATSVEVQSASSPSTDDSYSSGESGNVLMSHYKDEATGVTSTVFSASVSEALLEDFLHSQCCHRRDALPSITHPPEGKKLEAIGTTVSESSWKYCCSRECLDGFLKSTCSKRRSAVPYIRPWQSKGTSVSDLRCENELNIEYIPRIVVPPGGTQVIQLDERNLMEMLNDPNNPQPGPSSDSAQPEENKDDEQKGS